MDEFQRLIKEYWEMYARCFERCGEEGSENWRAICDDEISQWGDRRFSEFMTEVAP